LNSEAGPKRLGMPGNPREMITVAEGSPVRIRVAVLPAGLGQRRPPCQSFVRKVSRDACGPVKCSGGVAILTIEWLDGD
jgi:hypothetical protein